jgi:hypothetical protein
MHTRFSSWFSSAMIVIAGTSTIAQEKSENRVDLPAFGIVDGIGPDWKTLEQSDFVRANCDETTFVWNGSSCHCSGQPVGVLKSARTYKNFEFVAEWRHLSSGGNSGFFVWAPEAAFDGLEPGKLPKGGIEVQILDHGFAEKYLQRTGKKGDWFTTNGDVFAVGNSKMSPFEPRSPNGSRSFPREARSRGSPEWNHYYVRAIQGEIRLWVNGKEVSGGRDCMPAEGFLCLESEGAPIEWKYIRLRELP